MHKEVLKHCNLCKYTYQYLCLIIRLSVNLVTQALRVCNMMSHRGSNGLIAQFICFAKNKWRVQHLASFEVILFLNEKLFEITHLLKKRENMKNYFNLFTSIHSSTLVHPHLSGFYAKYLVLFSQRCISLFLYFFSIFSLLKFQRT